VVPSRAHKLVFEVAWGAVALALWGLSLSQIDPYRTGSLGLITVLPWTWWTGLAVTVIGGIRGSRETNDCRWHCPLGIGLLVLYLHGTGPAVDRSGYLDWAFVSAGFSNFIGGTGHTLPHFDARMSWPALYAAAGMVARTLRVSSTWFIRWTPLALNALYLVPLKSIANGQLNSRRARYATLAIFVAANWIAQDYFSPSGYLYFAYLTVLAICLRLFGSVRGTTKPQHALPPRWRWFAPARGDQAELSPLPAAQPNVRWAALGIVLLIVAATTVAHELTPVEIGFAAAALAITRRTELRWLWLMTFIFVLAWLSWDATAFWSGHFEQIFGQVGQVSGNVGSGIGARLNSPSIGRRVVLDARVLDTTVLMGSAMVIGGFELIYWHRTRWSAVALLAAPIVTIGLQDYGGEVALRVAFYALAPAAVLIGAVLDNPDDYFSTRYAQRGWRILAPWVRGGVFVSVMIVLVGLFPLARWGNQSFEVVSPSDIGAANWVYSNVPAGATLVYADGETPISYERIGQFGEVDLGDVAGMAPSTIRSLVAEVHMPAWLVLIPSEEADGETELGYPPGWMAAVGRTLSAAGVLRVKYRKDGSEVAQIVVGGRSK
jgi:hypothetical protein